MANHPNLITWQNKIKLLKAMNNNEDAPADVRKEAADRIKQLETAVTKFNGCVDAKYTDSWQKLEGEAAVTRTVLENLIERFEKVDGAAIYKEFVTPAITSVDKDIADMEKALPDKRAAITTAEQERDALKQQVADAEKTLKGIETLCDELGKWGADVAKARKEAEAIAPDQQPIEAWTAIKQLEAALGTLDNQLKGPDPATETAKTLAKEMTKLEPLLKNYRAKGQEVDNLKADLKAAEDALAAARKARADSILVKYEELRIEAAAAAEEAAAEAAAAATAEAAAAEAAAEAAAQPGQTPVGAAGNTTAQTATEASTSGDIN